MRLEDRSATDEDQGMQTDRPTPRMFLILAILGCLIVFTVVTKLPLLAKGILLQALIIAIVLVVAEHEPDESG